MKAKSPIVPVALVDSYKPFGINSLKQVTTQVHFLPPIYYEEYKEMTSKEVSDLARSRIMNVMKEACEG
jgi:1-acyl-sn-glycerol-3-phosphate acyltransferase